MAHSTGTCVTKMMPGMTTRREAERELAREVRPTWPRVSSQLENQPPSRLPTPAAANGTHA